MKLGQQVCSLELAQKLKELGVKQDSVYYWRSVSNNTAQEPENWYYSHRVVPSDEPVPEHFNNARLRFCSAFTVAELGEMLPRYIADADQPLSGVKGKQYPLIIECLADDYSSDNKINGWRIRYGDTKVKIDSEYKLNSAGIYYVGTEADARAKMLVYLLENKLITL